MPYASVIWDVHGQRACLNSKVCVHWSGLFELPFLVYVYKPGLCCLSQSGLVPVVWPVMMLSCVPDNNRQSRVMAPF